MGRNNAKEQHNIVMHHINATGQVVCFRVISLKKKSGVGSYGRLGMRGSPSESTIRKGKIEIRKGRNPINNMFLSNGCGATGSSPTKNTLYIAHSSRQLECLPPSPTSRGRVWMDGWGVGWRQYFLLSSQGRSLIK